MKNTLEIVGNVLLIILAIDLFGFMVWIASGQTGEGVSIRDQ